MGMVYGEDIGEAAMHLLKILEKEGSVDYSRFYDGSDETAGNLREALGFERDDEMTSVELLMDEAAAHLSSDGIVTLQNLDAKLADDEPDYRITLTDKGREALKAGTKFKFRDLDL